MFPHELKMHMQSYLCDERCYEDKEHIVDQEKA